MMLGQLIVFLATRDIPVNRLVLAALLTGGYMFMGILFEGRRLIRELGDRNRVYKIEVGIFYALR